MKIIYKNPGFEHSIESILLFQEDDMEPYWIDALYWFYPQLEKEKIIGHSMMEKQKYLTSELRAVWTDLCPELNKTVELYNYQFE